MEKYLSNTKKQYSISDAGIVFSNYRYKKNGEKWIRRRVITQYIDSPRRGFPMVSLFINGRLKVFCMSGLMEKYFNLSPPDRFHFYDLTTKNGDLKNLSVKNLTYKIRTKIKYPHYPQPFYNRGKITDKICGQCGHKKEISDFSLQTNNYKNGRGYNKTYRNICEQCRSAKQWAAIKADPSRLKRSYSFKDAWRKTSDGVSYYKKYNKIKYKNDYENLTLHYIAASLRMGMGDVTNTLLELSRKKIGLIRKVKHLKA